MTPINKDKIVSALYRISLELEKLPASQQQTKVSIMISDLTLRMNTNWEFPIPCEWMDREAKPNEI